MLLASWLNLEPPSWQTLAIPVAGLSAALLTLVAGRWALSRRRAARAAPAAAAAPVHDPFEHGSVTEQRGSVRRKGNPIEVLISDAEAEQEPLRGWVIDRSTNGLCLLLHEEIAAGTVLSVKPRQAPPGMPWVRAEVRSCKRDRTGYQAGCQFLSTPPWGILLLFG
jgi:hypothetical protein